MDQLIAKQFSRALLFLLEKEGRGAQTRLAREMDIDRGYLNAIIQGRKTGSEQVRGKIADHFHMPYEEMLALGKRLLEGSDQERGRFGQIEGRSDIDPVQGSGEKKEFSVASADSPRISETIRKAIVILESDDETRLKLAGLIDAFYNELMARKESDNLRAQVEQLASRIVHLEEVLEDEKNATRKSA
jgi:transcriptional regulator with XRE-family HTH domain